MPDDAEMSAELLEAYDAARTALLAEYDEKAVPLLLNSFGRGSGFGVYQLVSDVIRLFPQPVVIAALKQSLLSRHSGVRSWGWQIALEFPGHELVPLALRAVEGKDADERYDERYFAAAYLAADARPTDTASLRNLRDREDDQQLRLLISEALDRAAAGGSSPGGTQQPSTSVIDRWTTTDGAELAREIFRRLAKGTGLSGLPLDSYEGMIDLRGLTVPKPRAKSSIDRIIGGRLFGIERLEGVNQVRRARLENVDFSYADLGGLKVFESTINACRFEHADLRQAGLWACNVRATSFSHADLRSMVLGGAPDKGRTSYSNVNLKFADLRGASPGFADFVDCDFSNARLDSVEFYGNGLARCRFAGRLADVIFSKRGLTGDPHEGALEDVDFAQAAFQFCAFRGFDLDSVKFPEDSNHIVFRNYPCVLRRATESLRGSTDKDDRGLLALLEMELRWLGPRQRAGVLAVPDLQSARPKAEARGEWLRRLDEECSLESANARSSGGLD
jgi:uncharacterized protein YjbI with pentapeptide repeats